MTITEASLLAAAEAERDSLREMLKDPLADMEFLFGLESMTRAQIEEGVTLTRRCRLAVETAEAKLAAAEAREAAGLADFEIRARDLRHDDATRRGYAFAARLVRSLPTDRTALDALLAEERREALEEAARLADARADRCREAAGTVPEGYLKSREIAASAECRLLAAAIRTLSTPARREGE